MKISVYTSAFNIVKHGFVHWEKSLQLSSKLADEVIVCVNTSEDNTIEAINEIGLENLKIIQSDISYDDPLLDGKVKNTALQACTGDILIQLDLDEYIPENQHSIWKTYAWQLMSDENTDCYMFPVLNLMGSWCSYKDTGNKWYMHKRGFYRGPVGFARKIDGTVDTTKSDTCELIDSYDMLVRCKTLSPRIEDLRSGSPFVVHFGYLDLNARVQRNQEFWGEHWQKESGGIAPPHKVHMNIEEFNGETILKHGISI